MALISGSNGNDLYRGTAGVDDTAAIASTLTQARIAYNGGQWIVSSPAGTDTLASVEAIQFSDALLRLGAVPTPETQVNFTSLNDQIAPVVTALADGGHVVSWMSSAQDGSGYGIYAQRYDAAGVATGGETQVNTTISSDQMAPAVTGLSGGGYVVSWQSIFQDGSVNGIYAQRYDASGVAVGGETRVNTTTLNDQSAPAVTALQGGGYLVTWQAQVQDGSGNGIYAQRYDAGGLAVGGETRINTTTLNEQTAPAVTSLADGGYLVAWQSSVQDGSGWGIYTQRYDASGLAVGAETRANATVLNDQIAPAVTALAGGGYVVSWQSNFQDASGWGIYAQRYDAAGLAVGGEIRVNTATANDQTAPAVTALPDGGWLASWQSAFQDGSGNGIYAQRYDASGLAVGGEWLVNSTAFNDQSAPGVAALPDGSVVFTWQASGQDGSGSGIYSQRIAPGAIGLLPTVTGDAGDNVITAAPDANLALALLGGAGNDQLTGTALADQLDGGSGADTLDGGAGADTLSGGAGGDTYVVDAADLVNELGAPGDGIDVVQAGVAWTLGANLENLLLTGTAAVNGTGNALDNQLTGNAAANLLAGAAGNDTLAGGAGNDTLDGGLGNDALQGGDGSDTYLVDAAGDVLTDSGAGVGEVDTVQSSLSWTLGANLENLVLTGAAAQNGTGNTLNNLITGNSAANLLDGGAGNDTLDGGIGNDTLQGGDGSDTYVVDSSLDVVTDNGTGAGEVDTVSSAVNWTLGASFENLVMTGFGASAGTGNALDNRITGNVLGNTLAGGAGNDTLDGGDGSDLLQGGEGSDTYIVSVGDTVAEAGTGAGEVDTVQSDVTWTLGANLENLVLTGPVALNGTGNGLANQLTGNTAANALAGGAGADTLTGNAGNDTLDGGAGSDTLQGGEGSDSYLVDATTDVVIEGAGLAGEVDSVRATVHWTLGANLENLVLAGTAALTGRGNDQDNRLVGNLAGNTLEGGLGADILDGGAGADTLIGGDGNDLYTVDQVADLVIETSSVASQIDTVQAALSWTLGSNLENLVLTGVANSSGTGNALANRLSGNVGANLLDGGAGADTLVGGNGDDTYLVDTSDIVIELAGGGIDTVVSTATYTIASRDIENATLSGTAVGNLTGNQQNNLLTGNLADNVLNGSSGADTMVGGAGNDTYVVDSVGDVVTELAGEGSDTVVSSVSRSLEAAVEHLRLSGALAIDGTGNALDNLISGNAAANRLTGGAGSDTLVGGAGNDIYVVDAQDRITELAGGGQDQVLSSASWVLGTNLEDLLLTGSAAINGTGNTVANRLTGNAAANLLDGRAGADTMDGADGGDTYVVDNLGDLVNDSGTSGTDLVRASVTHALGVGVENLVLTGLAAIDGGGNTLNNQITGNSAANLLGGQAGNDRLDGAAGNDTLSGDAGIDTLIGGAGDDDLTSTDGQDSLVGGLGNDTYHVVGENDLLVEAAAQGVDTVLAQVQVGYTLGANLDNLILLGGDVEGHGNTLVNAITGTAGHNLLDGGGGADTLTGGAGNDTYVVDNALDSLVEAVGEGADTVIASLSWTLGADFEDLTLAGAAAIDGTGNALDNLLVGNDAANHLLGLAGQDLVFGGGGNDAIDAGLGDDLVDGGAGNDTLIGGDGNDTLSYFTAATGVTVDLSVLTAQVTGGAGTDLISGFEHLQGSNGGADRLSGTVDANQIDGAAGNDTLSGGAGNDVLTGGEDQDLLIADAGDDVLDGGMGSDTADYSAAVGNLVLRLDGFDVQLAGNLGSDLLVDIENLIGSATGNDSLTGNVDANLLSGLGGNDVLSGSLGDDTLDGGAGIDRADYADAADGVVADLGTGSASNDGFGNTDLLVGIENLSGGDQGDWLAGDAAANTLDGRLGNDSLIGGDGSDTYVVNSALDVVVESNTSAATGGVDLVLSASNSYTLGANVENGRITASGTSNLTGNTLNNLLYAGAGSNVINGGTGIDTVSYQFVTVGVTVSLALTTAQATGGSGSDTLLALENLSGSALNDSLTGNTLANLLGGAAGLDSLSGGDGNDTLAGGLGNDLLTGGLGLDSFVFDSALGATNLDVVNDFSVLDDTISLENAVFTSLSVTGALAAGSLRVGAGVITAADANDYLIYNSSTGALYYDADGSGAASTAQQFATLGTGLVLTAADFIIT